MNRIVFAAGLALAQLFAVNVMAQSKGEVDPGQSKAAPCKPATAQEKAAAKAARRAEGAAAAKAFTGGDCPDTTAKAGVATKEQRVAAAKARKAAAAAAVKKGETGSGEK